MFDSSEKFLSALDNLPFASLRFQDLAVERQHNLTKPQGSLGILEEITVWLSGWQEKERLSVAKIEGLLFAGNHGVIEENISSFPAAVTGQMVQNFQQGKAAINALTGVFGHNLRVFPIDLSNPTNNFLKSPAMSANETLDALNIGATAVNESDADLIYFGEMGIGNTTSASALSACVFGGKGIDWAGPGTGLSAEGVRHKADIIDQGLGLHQNKCNNPFDVMSCFGGRELAAIMGATVAARLRRIPVLLDGFVVTAAVAPLVMKGRDVLDHCMAAHNSAEPGHQRLLDNLWMQPLLQLHMRLGEGTGAALAAELVKGAVATYNEMATFQEAEISRTLT